MFHRVKSEVQDSDQENQQKADLPYAGEEDSREYKGQKSLEAEEPRDEPAYTPKGKYMPKSEEDRPSARTQKEHVEEETVAAPEQQESARSYEAPATGYQRTTFQPAAPRSAGGYSASYTPPQSGNEIPHLPGGERTLTIGRGINMSGEIEACDHLLVEGTVEAALKGSKVLDIAESGTFYGTVEIEEATIAGRFEGDITVNGRLTIKASGAITGSIAYRELEVEAGAMLDGRMTPLKEPVDTKRVDQYRSGTEASAMAKAKEIISKKDNREPANTESRLFSKARA